MNTTHNNIILKAKITEYTLMLHGRNHICWLYNHISSYMKVTCVVVLGIFPLTQEVDMVKQLKSLTMYALSIWNYTTNLKTIHPLGAKIFVMKIFPINPLVKMARSLNLKSIHISRAEITVSKFGQMDKLIPIYHCLFEWGYIKTSRKW